MRKQRKTYFKRKKKDKTPEELSEMEISNLPENVFKVMIVKMIKELKKRIDAQSKKLEFFLTKG